MSWSKAFKKILIDYIFSIPKIETILKTVGVFDNYYCLNNLFEKVKGHKINCLVPKNVELEYSISIVKLLKHKSNTTQSKKSEKKKRSAMKIIQLTRLTNECIDMLQ